MWRLANFVFCVVLLNCSTAVTADKSRSNSNALLRFNGICDGSAGVELADGQLLVGYDESNAWYRFDAGGGHYRNSIDYAAQLGFVDGAELDIEAVATVADNIWWLGSHGRDGNGDIAANRRSLFRTTRGAPTSVAGGAVDVLKQLEDSLFSAKALANKPRKGGVNFEGLAAGAKGALMIGVRSPLSKGKSGHAMVIEWQPESTSSKTHWLDLGDRGIRALARFREGYLLIAGGAESRGVFTLFYWSPVGAAVELPILDSRLRAEAIVKTAAGVLILSDDGKVKRGDNSAKKGKRTCDRIRRKNPAADQHPNVYFRAQAIGHDELDAAVRLARR